MDEWGQIAILKLLLRYGRTQFLDPNQGGNVPVVEKSFYADEDDEEEDDKDEKGEYLTHDALT